MTFDVSFKGKTIKAELPDTVKCDEMHKCVYSAYTWFKNSYDPEYGYADELRNYYFIYAVMSAFSSLDMKDATLDDVAAMAQLSDFFNEPDFCAIDWVYEMHRAYNGMVNRLTNRSEKDELATAVLEIIKNLKALGESEEIQALLGNIGQAGSNGAE